ncbi:alcohol dehydrogenase 1-like [Malus sylvestris]|uniref:alcohol dehydrogenase 1-like n=1 Tax=Malus sylvestris TaxID=3752 RepID=UPI0021ABCF71|nr:alcohol dehydrogenase 1-like [Malus sylvestris]
MGDRKLLVMERVKVAPPKAMEIRVKVKYTSVYHTELYFYRRFGCHSQCSKTKNYPQLWFIGLAATEGARISGVPLSIGVESVDLKPKRFDEGIYLFFFYVWIWIWFNK